MLKMVLYEYLQGRRSPAQWFCDAKEHNAMRWLGRGIQPSRTAWYQFRDRIGDLVERLHVDLIRRSRDAGLLDAEEGVQDGTTIEACASRHRVVNQPTLHKRRAILQELINSERSDNASHDEIPKWVPTSVAGREDLADRMKQAQEILSNRLAENATKPADKRKDPDRVREYGDIA